MLLDRIDHQTPDEALVSMSSDDDRGAVLPRSTRSTQTKPVGLRAQEPTLNGFGAADPMT